MDPSTRQRDLERVHQAHRDLLDHLDGITGEPGGDPARASLLPDWTVGYVLTHVARNADSFVRVLSFAERDEEVSQYAGGPAQRDADIERGAGRPWDAIVEDVRASAAALDELMARQTRWDLTLHRPNGELVPHTEIPFHRWREVLVHHVDLGDPGYTADSWPDEYVRQDIRRLAMRWDARRPMGATGLPGAALRAAPTTRLLWLLGRADIEGLEPANVF